MPEEISLQVFDLPPHPAAELFPLVSGVELEELAADIAANGLHEPVWLYEDPDHGAMLLDGRSRTAACRMIGREIQPEDINWYDGDDPIGFSVSLNLRRRHLTTGQRAAVGAAIEPLYAAQAAKRKALSPGRPRKELAEKHVADLPQVFDLRKPVKDQKKKRTPLARDSAAAVVGTSGRAVGQFVRIEKQAPDLAEQVRAGALALDRAERIIRDREAEQRRVEQARRQAEQADVPTRVEIRHGDFREALADLSDVDAIITDPPYPGEFLPLLDDLATWSSDVLGPNGVLAVLIGQTHLPEVYRRLAQGRPYRWTACLLTAGNGYVSHPRRVQSNWKPVLIYGGGPRFSDVVHSEGSDAGAKSLHKWGQDYNAFHTLVERLTERGQVVVDPFMGSGTTLLAARALGRHVIGCDIDEAAVLTARQRLS